MKTLLDAAMNKPLTPIESCIVQATGIQCAIEGKEPTNSILRRVSDLIDALQEAREEIDD